MLAVTAVNVCKAQTYCLNNNDSILFHLDQSKSGLVYYHVILYQTNNIGDSVAEIEIEGDTMKAVKNMLVYLLQQKSENDDASIILSMINLDYLKTFGPFKGDKTFSYYVDDYKKVVAKNKGELRKRFPEEAKYIR